MGAAGPDLPKHLTDDERAVYEQAERTRRTIREMLASLSPREARTRASWRAADEEAACIQLVLEWEALKRAKEARKSSHDREPSADDSHDSEGEPNIHGD
jgi:hypothetical protein